MESYETGYLSNPSRVPRRRKVALFIGSAGAVAALSIAFVLFDGLFTPQTDSSLSSAQREETRSMLIDTFGMACPAGCAPIEIALSQEKERILGVKIQCDEPGWKELCASTDKWTSIDPMDSYLILQSECFDMGRVMGEFRAPVVRESPGTTQGAVLFEGAKGSRNRLVYVWAVPVDENSSRRFKSLFVDH